MAIGTLFFCQYSIYLEFYTTLHIVPHQGRVLLEGFESLSFWLIFFVSFKIYLHNCSVCMYVAIYLDSCVLFVP